MKINVTPNIDQIRNYAKSALNVWGVLPDDLAKTNVISAMKSLLRYLDAFDKGDGIVVVGITGIERGIRLEVSRGDRQVFDLTDRYFGEGQISHVASYLQETACGNVEGMRPHSVVGAESTEVDLAVLPERKPQG
jgi:hypothetical protein